jgi:hypothetical protein
MRWCLDLTTIRTHPQVNDHEGAYITHLATKTILQQNGESNVGPMLQNHTHIAKLTADA